MFGVALLLVVLMGGLTTILCPLDELREEAIYPWLL